MQAARTRPELTVTEIAAPGSLAPNAIALAADVMPARHGIDSPLGTGRFILLHDPAAPEAWGGEFRVVCFAQSPLDTDMGLDPFMAEVAWSWLVDALAASGAQYHSASGTATKILSTGFGELESPGRWRGHRAPRIVDPRRRRNRPTCGRVERAIVHVGRASPGS